MCAHKRTFFTPEDKMLDFGYYNMDCMDGMKEFPDKYFDIAVVDPPYGININMNIGLKKGQKKKREQKNWDKNAPNNRYFEELFRVSKKQIIWGGNYFNLPPCHCFIIWDKGESMYGRSFSECEYAWTSFDESARIIKIFPNQPDRIHPTQKPKELYDFIYHKFTQRGMKLLDTYVGSANSLISAYDFGLNFVGFELDKEYYQKSKERLEAHTAQMNIFDLMENVKNC